MLSKIVILAVIGLAASHHEATPLGSFTNYQHGIAGEVFALSESQIFVKDFSYDGAGPDAFFWVGVTPETSDVGTILPHPFKGKFYDYEDGSAPILEGRFDKVNITLTLPPGQKVSDLKWISVWCRAYKVNFGDLYLPADLEIEAHPEAESEAESEPESEAEAESEAESEPEGYDHGAKPEGDIPPPLVHNAHDPNHRHNGDEDVSYAESEAESEAESKAEAESESEPGSAVGLASSSLTFGLVMASLVLVR